MKEDTDNSNFESYSWYRLALVLDGQNQELNSLVFNLEHKEFGEEPRDDYPPIFVKDGDDNLPLV